MMGRKACILQSVLFLCFFTTLCAKSSTETIFINSMYCNFKIRRVNEDKSYVLEWNGVDPGMTGCSYSFIGRSSRFGDTYKVCVEAETFYFQNNKIFLKYSVGYSTQPSKTFTMNDYPEKFCAGEDEYLDIDLDVDSVDDRIFTRFPTESSYFKLLITATKIKSAKDLSSDEPNIRLIGTIVGAVLLVLSMICSLIVCLCKRLAASGQNASPTESYPLSRGEPVFNSPHQVQPPVQGFTAYSDNSGQAYPQQGYFTYPNQPTGPLQHEDDKCTKGLSAPPPSYDEVISSAKPEPV